MKSTNRTIKMWAAIMALFPVACQPGMDTADAGQEEESVSAEALDLTGGGGGSAAYLPYISLKFGAMGGDNSQNGRACYSNPDNGQPALCLELTNRFAPRASPEAGDVAVIKPTLIWRARICKVSSSGVFVNQHAWHLTDHSGHLTSQVFEDPNGGECGGWNEVNLSTLPCGDSLLQASVWSPSDCQSSECEFRTGAIEVNKYCPEE